MKQIKKKIISSLQYLDKNTFVKHFFKLNKNLTEILTPHTSEQLRSYATLQCGPTMLDVERFSLYEVQQSLNQAKSRFPKEKIFLLTDRQNLQVPGTIRIASIGEAIRQRTNSEAIVFITAFDSDEKMLNTIHQIINLKNAYYYSPVALYPPARYFQGHDLVKKSLSYSLRHTQNLGVFFDLGDYENLLQAIDITSLLPGDYLEVGVYKGRSAIVALDYFRRLNLRRNSFFVDTFEGFTYVRAATSPDAVCYTTHQDTSFAAVNRLLSKYPDAKVVKGDIIDMDISKITRQLALVNIDVDMYEAVFSSLIKVAPLLIKKGLILVEDYGHTPYLTGAYLAVNQFLSTPLGKKFISLYLPSGHCFLINTG